MRQILFFSSFLLMANLLAQNKKTTADSTTKVVYTDIVKVDSTNRFELYQKASKWIGSQSFTLVEENILEGKIMAKNSFDVFSEKGVLSKPNGVFTHDVSIDVKDGKYRYTFSNFLYRKYKQDRQDLLKYIPERSTKAIEDNKAPGWSKQWSKNKMQATDKINQYIISLRDAMKYVARKTAAPPKPKEEW